MRVSEQRAADHEDHATGHGGGEETSGNRVATTEGDVPTRAGPIRAGNHEKQCDYR